MTVSVSATNSTCLHLKLKQVRLYIINRLNGSQAVLLHCQRQHRGHSLLRLLPCRLLKLRLLVCNIVSCFFVVFGISRDTIHTHTFNGPFSGTTQVGRYQKGKTNMDFTEARGNEWQWHQLGHMQVCTSLQFFTGRMPFLPPNHQRQSTEG